MTKRSKAAFGKKEQEILDVAGGFLFRRGAVQKSVSVLSGGERARLCLAGLMLGDLNVAEPKALIGFAGPRVIEQTIRQKLPEGFQRAEFLLAHGFLDAVVHRKDLKSYIANALDVFLA